MIGNLTDTEKYIDKELQAIGWPKLDLANKQQTLGCLFSLLKQRSRDVGYREDLQQRIRLLDQDSVNNESNLKKLSVKLDAKANETKEVKLQNDSLTAKVKSLTKKVHIATEDAKKAKTTLVQVKSQYEHEIRKLHLEKEKMKDKISKLVTERGPKAGSSMFLSNPLDFVLSPEQRKNEDMYNIVISNYEDHEKELMAENAGLRGILLEVFHLIDKKTESRSQTTNAKLFHLPLDMMRVDLMHMMDVAIERVASASVVNTMSMETIAAEIETLKSKLEQQDQIISDQQRMLEISMEDSSQTSLSADFEKLKLDQQLLEKEKNQLELDRGKFTDAAIKLGLERANLQKERLALEEERSKSSTSTIPNPPLLASTPTWLKSKIRKEEFLLSNNSSPAPRKLMKSGGDDWFASESPLDNQENEYAPSEILIESLTLNTPVSAVTKSAKSVRIQSSSGQEGFKKAAETVRLQNSLSMKKRQSPFGNLHLKPMATSTPL